MTKLVMWSVCVMAACGGKKAATTPADPEPAVEKQPATDPASMVSAETMDEITRIFKRKGNAVSHCLATVIDNKELPKNSRGKITLEVTIAASGKPESVKILKATLESKSLQDCVMDRVKEIQFPTLPSAYPTTYTYAFEAA